MALVPVGPAGPPARLTPWPATGPAAGLRGWKSLSLAGPGPGQTSAQMSPGQSLSTVSDDGKLSFY